MTLNEKKRVKRKKVQKKLYRDSKHKLLGGVAAGIANYFSIDPLWIRLLFIVLVFDIFLTFSISSLAIIGYIVMWIVLPESDKLREDKKTKKMYRNPDDRVLGGVASGVAAYFGADAVIIRLLFVLTIFLGGTGLIVYIILWIILPEASTITDKVEMKGEPVTLSNIESNIKGSLNVKEEKEDESVFTKIILLPFRIIALIISGLSKALGPVMLFLVDAIRIFAGFIMSIVGVALIFALVVLAGVLLGLLSGAEFVEIDGFPVTLLEESLPIWGIFATFIAIGIPSLVLILLGISVIGRTRTINPTVGWSMFAIWIRGILLVFHIHLPQCGI